MAVMGSTSAPITQCRTTENPFAQHIIQHHAIVLPFTDTSEMKQALTAGSSGSICAPSSFSSISDILLSLSLCFMNTSVLLAGISVRCCWRCGNVMSCMVMWSRQRWNYGVNRWFSANGERALFLVFFSSVSARAPRLLQRVIRDRVTQLWPATRGLTETTGRLVMDEWMYSNTRTPEAWFTKIWVNCGRCVYNAKFDCHIRVE